MIVYFIEYSRQSIMSFFLCFLTTMTRRAIILVSPVSLIICEEFWAAFQEWTKEVFGRTRVRVLDEEGKSTDDTIIQ